MRGKLPLPRFQSWEGKEMDSLVAQIVESFKAAYGLKITDSGDLFLDRA